MKKILIIGPFSDFGGREVEANAIILFLEKKYVVSIFSTIQMTPKSIVLNKVESDWTSFYKKIFDTNLILKKLSLFLKKWFKSPLHPYIFINNKISRLFFDFQKANISIIKKEIDQVDAILFCGIFSNGFLKEILEHSFLSKKSFFFRTTGTITEVPDNLKFFLNKVSKIIVHSSFNTLVLKENDIENIAIIDQTTLSEEDLITIPICETNELRYGYIGRFSPEKGILELLDEFEDLGKKIIIAGSGPLQVNVENKCAENPLFTYAGEIIQTKLSDFFSKIDVLIIPSFEESGPLVGIEAMAAGKIIVSTKVGAMMDRLKDTKNEFWFDIEDGQSLSRVISSIERLDKIEIKIIRNELRKKYKNNFSKKAVEQQYMNLLDEML